MPTQLVICCFWTFAFQTIGMSYYLYSAELPSAVLRSERPYMTARSNGADYRSQNRTYNLLYQLHHRYRQLVSTCMPMTVVQAMMLTVHTFSYATPPLLLNLSLRAGFVYGAFSVPMCVLMWLYLPETKGYALSMNRRDDGLFVLTRM